MKLAWKELTRRPSRFLTAGGALTLIVILLLLLGGLLDGLYLSATAAIRAQSASVIVYSTDSRDSLIRSKIDPGTRAEIESRKVLLRLYRFLKRQPGLSDLRIASCATETGIRETVTIKGARVIPVFSECSPCRIVTQPCQAS